MLAFIVLLGAACAAVKIIRLRGSIISKLPVRQTMLAETIASRSVAAELSFTSPDSYLMI